MSETETGSQRRTALVTGGSRGIGRAVSLELAAAGNAIAVNYASRPDAADAVVAEIIESGGAAMAVQADVSDPDAVAAMFERVASELGAPEILVNNAGITRDNLILRLAVDDWDDVLAVNLRSAYLTSKAALRQMLRARWGRIINISSVSGIAGNAGQTNYAASKAGLIGFTKSLAKEVGSRGITANVVAPGYIETDMTDALGDDVAAAAADSTTLGRLGTPAEVASAVGYLASERASYVTGQVLVVDGGLAI
jgi:3-oxoacyl-[acyl-carrier protein] reductase